MKLRAIGLILALTATLGTACGGDDEGDSASGISLSEPIGTTSGSESDSLEDAPSSVAKSAFAAMTVPRTELDSAAQAVVDLATSSGVGGFLVSSIFDTEDGYGAARVVVRVPSPNFESVVGKLGEIGEVTRQQLEGQDLSADVVASRGAVVRARARTGDLIRRLQETDSDGSRFELRQQVRDAKADLRSARRNSARLDTDVGLSMVEVSLRATPPPPPPEEPVLQRSLGTARSITLGIASGTVLVAGVLVPLVAMLVLVLLVGRPIIRWLRPRLQGWPA